MSTTQETPLAYEPLWGVDDVARYLKKSRWQTWRLIHKHGLPCSKIGGDTSPLRFRPEEVRAWVIRNEFDSASS